MNRNVPPIVQPVIIPSPRKKSSSSSLVGMLSSCGCSLLAGVFLGLISIWLFGESEHLPRINALHGAMLVSAILAFVFPISIGKFYGSHWVMREQMLPIWILTTIFFILTAVLICLGFCMAFVFGLQDLFDLIDFRWTPY